MRGYTLNIEGIAWTAALVLAQINAAATKSVILTHIEIGQETIEVSEQKALQIIRVTTAGTNTAATATPLDTGDTAFGGTCGVLATVDPTLSTVRRRIGWNILGGWVWDFGGDFHRGIALPGGDRIAIRAPTAPSGSTTLSGFIEFYEIG